MTAWDREQAMFSYGLCIILLCLRILPQRCVVVSYRSMYGPLYAIYTYHTISIRKYVVDIVLRTPYRAITHNECRLYFISPHHIALFSINYLLFTWLMHRVNVWCVSIYTSLGISTGTVNTWMNTLEPQHFISVCVCLGVVCLLLLLLLMLLLLLLFLW